MPSDESDSPPLDSNRNNVTSFPRRGEIYFVDLDPIIGSEQGGHRPALVIQNDVGNQYSPIIIVAAITSRPSARPRLTDVSIQPGSSGLRLQSRVLLNQIRTIDKRRVGSYVGHLTSEEMSKINEAITISLGLIPI